MGALWENYLVSERRKFLSYSQSPARSHFWRTTTKSEIDYVEECDGRISAYEFKWNPAKAANAKCPKAFAAAYPHASWHCISRENYVEFIMGLI